MSTTRSPTIFCTACVSKPRIRCVDGAPRTNRGKTPLDWFWLLGYLAQKAATSALRAEESLARGEGEPEIGRHLQKALHHTISTAAALLNWHAQLKGQPLSDLSMRPGIEPDEGLGRSD